MYTTQIEQLVKKALSDVDNFNKLPAPKIVKDELIKLYWQYHQRFKFFKLSAVQNGAILDIGGGGILVAEFNNQALVIEGIIMEIKLILENACHPIGFENSSIGIFIFPYQYRLLDTYGICEHELFRLEIIILFICPIPEPQVKVDLVRRRFDVNFINTQQVHTCIDDVCSMDIAPVHGHNAP